MTLDLKNIVFLGNGTIGIEIALGDHESADEEFLMTLGFDFMDDTEDGSGYWGMLVEPGDPMYNKFVALAETYSLGRGINE